MPDQPPRQQSSGFMGTLKSKWGPLPVWGWLALITVVLLGYWLWAQRKSSAQPAATLTGQPGVTVINQAAPVIPPSATTPPKPPEKKHKDSDEDEDEKRKHGRHQRHHSHGTVPGSPPPAPAPPGPPIPQPAPDTGTVPAAAGT